MPQTAATFFLLLLLPLPVCAQLSLEVIEKLVQRNFPVTNISWQELKQRIAASDTAPYLLFDTRAPEEYQTSHLHSAIQVDAQMTAADFIKMYGDTLQGKHAVFYCSVGYRSSIFVQRVQPEVLKAGARSVANLRGGIFRWYNEANPVVDARGETEKIHSYDSFWGALLRARERKQND